MGYEVLDVGTPGAGSGVPGTDSGPGRPHRPDDPEVVNLDALPEPPPAATPPPTSRLLGPTALRARTAVVLLLVLAAGAVAGATWAGSMERKERAAERRATLAVTALADSWTRVRWIRRPVVDVVVRLVNTGPMPIEVVPSFFGDRPRRSAPFVRALGGGLTVPAGRELAVSVLQRLDCSSSVPLTLELPVRTPDGVVHQVRVRRGGSDRLVPAEVCLEGVDELGVSATVAGSLRRPVLELRNPLTRPVTILFDPMQPPPQAQQLSIDMAPRLPARIPPGETRRLALDVQTPSCSGDATVPQGAGKINLVALSEVPGAGQGSSLDTERQPLQVDLSTLVGAALQRACD
jgi:hypothetical protein